jgi:hypothetical protein
MRDLAGVRGRRRRRPRALATRQPRPRPVVDGSPLNVTATTYGDRLSFGILACEDVLPDPGDIAVRLPDAMQELVKLTAG